MSSSPKNLEKYIGLAPWRSHHDDGPVVLLNACMPFVIRRPGRQSNNEHMLVGPAYIHGLNAKKIMDRADQGDISQPKRILLH